MFRQLLGSRRSGDQLDREDEQEDLATETSTWDPDEPLRDPNFDKLGRAPFAAAVADVIRNRRAEASIVIGLFGPWGDGKTTVLNFVRADLQKDPRFVVVDFNPWLVSNERLLLPAFFQQVASALDRRLGGKKRRVADALRVFGQAVDSASVPVAAGSVGVAGGGANVLAQKLAGQDLDALRRDFEALLRETQKRIVVVVDDLDRLDVDEIRAMFRLIRLAAPFARVTYLVACDDAVVAEALRTIYPNRQETGQSYLEKIVQVPLHIPPASYLSLSRLALGGFERLLEENGLEVGDDVIREIGQRYRVGVGPALATPRQIGRMLNALAFALPRLKGEANIADLFAVEAIHVLYPSLYRGMREHRDWFVQPVSPFLLGNDHRAEYAAARKRIEPLIDELGTADRDAATSLIRALFPALNAIWADERPSPDDDSFYAHQRMASPAYYDRYLSYGLPSDEIADGVIDHLVADSSSVGDRLTQVLEDRGSAIVGPLTRKLDVRVDRMSVPSAKALLDALPYLGGAVLDTVPNATIFGRSLQEQLAVLIVRLVMRLPSTDQLDAALAVVGRAEPLTFALECARWFRAKKDDAGERVLDEAAATKLQDLLGQRIASSLDPDTPIWNHEPRWPPLLSIAAESHSSEVRRAVAGWLDTQPKDVNTLLTGLAGQSTNLSTGERVQDDLTKQTFDFLPNIVDLDVVRGAVAKSYGSIATPAQFGDASYSRDPTRTVVEQFVFFDQPSTPVDEAARKAS